MYFTVEEENLICLYHKSDRRRTMARQTLDKLESMSDADFGAQRFRLTDE